MPIDYAQEAIDLGNLFQKIAHQMGDYLQANINTMKNDSVALKKFTDAQTQVLSSANTFYSLGDKIAFANDAQYFQKVDEATKAVNENLQTIQNVDKWIAFATALISMAASIATGSGSGILSSAETILGTFNVSLP